MSSENISKIRSYLGFAIRSGKAVYGIDNIERLRRPPKLAILDINAGNDTKKRAEAYCEYYKVALLRTKNISAICTKNGVKLIAVKEPNLAEAILTLAGDREVFE